MNDKTKLPVWAQNRIDKLERDLADAERRISQMTGETETNTFYDTHDNVKPLPADTKILFFAQNGKKYEVTINQGVLSIYSTTRLWITPQGGVNVINIRMEDR